MPKGGSAEPPKATLSGRGTSHSCAARRMPLQRRGHRFLSRRAWSGSSADPVWPRPGSHSKGKGRKKGKKSHCLTVVFITFKQFACLGGKSLASLNRAWIEATTSWHRSKKDSKNCEAAFLSLHSVLFFLEIFAVDLTCSTFLFLAFSKCSRLPQGGSAEPSKATRGTPPGGQEWI